MLFYSKLPLDFSSLNGSPSRRLYDSKKLINQMPWSDVSKLTGTGTNDYYQ